MIVVVYNPYDIISVFTAALYSANSYDIYKTTEMIPDDAAQYKFLGVNKFNTPKGLKTIFEDENRYKQYSTFTIDKDGFKNDMFSLACSELQIDSKGLGHLLVNFNENKLTMKELQLVYVNLKLAEKCIIENTVYKPTDVVDETSIKNFFQYISLVKRKAERNYTIQYIETKNKFIRTVISFNDDFIWIKRLFMLGHKNIANIVATVNGCIVDTNLEDINKLTVDMMCHKSNEVFIKLK